MTATNLHAPALRATFLHAYDEFSTDPSAVATLPEVTNVRYARELLATLVAADLVTISGVNGEYEVWQTVLTSDSMDRATAVEMIDEFLSNNPTIQPAYNPKAANMTSKKSSTVANPNLTPCPCGCGLTANSRKTTYRPGHDARHAGQVARAILAGASPTETARLMNSLPTFALKGKAQAQVARGQAKKTTPKAAPKAQPATLTGTVKIGRWTYQAEMTPGADSLRYRKDENSVWKGTTKAKEVAAFVPNA